LKNEPALVQRLAEATHFCGYILGDFLEYTKYQNDLLTVNRYGEMDLGAEIEELIGYHRQMMEEKDVRIDLQVSDDLPGLIVSDRIKVNRIFLNLLTNAIKNTPEEGLIHVNLGLAGGKWELAIMNPTKQQAIEPLSDLFLPYREAQASNGSYGLGLPITKMLVEALEGRISAHYCGESSILFTITIPLI
jgi:signal transduction histidine kinase